MADYPSTPQPFSQQLELVQPTYGSLTHSNVFVGRARPGAAFWRVRLIYAGLTSDEFWPLWAFLNKQQGRLNAFTFECFNVPMKSTDFSVQIAGAGQTGTAISVDNHTGTAAAGDLCTIGDASTRLTNGLFQVTEQLVGDGVLNIVPPILVAQAAGTNIRFNEHTMTVRVATDFVLQSFDLCLRQRDFSVELLETRRDAG